MGSRTGDTAVELARFADVTVVGVEESPAKVNTNFSTTRMNVVVMLQHCICFRFAMRQDEHKKPV